MKEGYVVPDRHIRYAATKAFSGTNMTEGSFIRSHGVKMLSLVEKLEDLKTGLDNDTYIDLILQSLLSSYDPFIINYNMNRLEKTIHELINMLVQFWRQVCAGNFGRRGFHLQGERQEGPTLE
ncbi:UNVERIFIED_CONTAM: hypothetical protein Sradi_2358900 [Sesamum radiatum]|uniref:Uncharacterized protein n=1 Tax=Sesamum radiatum TaxID=300843 RepID=A0AAW2T936_SESRA